MSDRPPPFPGDPLDGFERGGRQTNEWLREYGARLWPLLRTGRASRENQLERLSEYLALTGRGTLWGQKSALFAVDWADFAFPTLTTSHRYAAAMMCTKVTSDIASEVAWPWPVFVAQVPNGLLIADGVEYGSVRLHSSAHDAAAYGATLMLETSGFGHGRLEIVLRPVELFSPDSNIGPTSFTGAQERVVHLARRLVAGLVLTMQNTTNFKDRGPRSFGQSRKRGEPDHRIIAIGEPLSIDCRPAVADYLAGERKGGPVSVQTLVRGHYKRQVTGVGRADRKIIWVQPYWRGPEDAPIMVRPYKVGP